MRFKGRKVLAAFVAVLALGAVSAAPALAAGKPLVQTDGATEIGETSTTLNGIVDPNGAETKYYFEHSPNKHTVEELSAPKTPEATLAAGGSGVEVSKAIATLKAGTTYYFRIVAKNTYGTTPGEILSFTTKELPEFATGTGENFPVKFEKHGTGEPTLETKAKRWVLCSESKTTGEITTAKAVSVRLEWTGCLGAAREGAVNSKGSPSGTVVIKGSGTLAFISKAKEQIGIAVALERTEMEDPSQEYSFALQGHIVVPVTPLNTKTLEMDLALHAKSAGEQEFKSYENEAGKLIEAFPEFEFGQGFEQAALTVSGADAMSLSKALTVKG